MQKLNYPLNAYIKAVEIMLEKKHLQCLKVYNKSGSAVHFDLFEIGNEVPVSMWQVHTEHKNKRRIISKEDYKKAARCLNCSLEEFIFILDSV